MSDPIMHSRTKQELAAILANPPQSLGLIGPDGIGKTTIAKWLAAQLIGDATVDKYQYFHIIEPDSSISIEQIRELNNFLKLKTPGDKPLRRFVVIKHADAMTIEAQNSLLKSLEEPPTDTLIVLTFSTTKSLLPTITSRLQTITIRQPSHDDIMIMRSTSDANFDKSYSLSGNMPALLHSLLNDESHPLAKAIDTSKALLREKSFERLSKVDELSKDKHQAQMITVALIRMADVSITAAAKKTNSASIKQWERVLSLAQKAHEAILANAQRKLVLTNLLLNI